MKFIPFLTVLMLVPGMALAGSGISGDVSPVFDVSPDDQKMVFAVSKGKASHLWEYTFSDGTYRQLTEGKSVYHDRPVYSHDGSRVLFLIKDNEKTESQLGLLDVASGKIEQLTFGDKYVSEAVFHPDGKHIVYCGAGFVGSYSPRASSSPHKVDIYSITLEGQQLTKITNLDAYSLSSIALTATGDSILFELNTREEGGMFIVPLTNPATMDKIEAVNNPRPQVGDRFYGSPSFSPDHAEILFIAPYQIYRMGRDDRQCELVWDNKKEDVMAMPIHARFMHSGDRIIFSTLEVDNRQYASNAGIYILDPGSGKVTAITFD